MNLDCNDILPLFRSQFDQLWHCEQRGETLVIHSPYMMPDSTGITFYLTKRQGMWIVSDGARIEEFFREHLSTELLDRHDLSRILLDRYKIEQTTGTDGLQYFFKRTENPELLPSLAFDLAHFTLSLAGQDFFLLSQTADEKARKFFYRKADDFVVKIKLADYDFKRNFKAREIPGASFSGAVISPGHLWLLSYVSGTAANYFERSLSNSYVNFQLAAESILKPRIVERIALLDDTANGYKAESLGPKMDMLRKQDTKIVKWSNRENLKDLLKAA